MVTDRFSSQKIRNAENIPMSWLFFLMVSIIYWDLL